MSGTTPIGIDAISPSDDTPFPYDWCYKRLTKGTEENVWHKYQILVLSKPGQ